MSDHDSARVSLYERYASSRAGYGRNRQENRIFRRDFAPFLPCAQDCDVLDLGCGQGGLIACFLANGYTSVRGIDLSPEQVDVAHARGLTMVELGDYRFALGETSLDVVTATDFFEHFSKDEVLEALHLIYVSLRPRGVLIARVPNAVSPLNGNYQHGDFTHLTSFTASSVRQLAKLVGFSDVAVRPCNPVPHGIVSSLRYGLWGVFATVIKIALASETGLVRGNIVTQNLTFLMRKV